MTRQRKSKQGAKRAAGEAPRELDDACTASGAGPAAASSSQQPAAPVAPMSSAALPPMMSSKPTPTLSGLPVELKQQILDELVWSIRVVDDDDDEEEETEDDDVDMDDVDMDSDGSVYFGSGAQKSLRRGLDSLSKVNREWNALCSRHFWEDIGLSKASLDALRYFVLEILPRHVHSIRSLDMRLTASEQAVEGCTSDFGKTAIMSTTEADRTYGDRARSLRRSAGARTEDKLLKMHRQRQLQLAGLPTKPPNAKRRGLQHTSPKYQQAFRQARAQVKKQLERGERHNMFLEILKAAPLVEEVFMDGVPFNLEDDQARHAGVAEELHHVVMGKAKTLKSLDIHVKAPASFDCETLAKTLQPLTQLSELTIYDIDDHENVGECADGKVQQLCDTIPALDKLEVLSLRNCHFVSDDWASLERSPRFAWPLKTLTLTDMTHCTFDVLHAIIDCCSATLEYLELQQTPVAPEDIEMLPGGLDDPAHMDHTAQLQTSEQVTSLLPADRSLAIPFTECPKLEFVTIATAFNGSFLKLFEQCKAIETLCLQSCARFAPGDVLAFLRAHPRLDELDITEEFDLPARTGWEAVVDYCDEHGIIVVEGADSVDYSDYSDEDEDRYYNEDDDWDSEEDAMLGIDDPADLFMHHMGGLHLDDADDTDDDSDDSDDDDDDDDEAYGADDLD